jgi:dienelactone hydrolase
MSNSLTVSLATLAALTAMTTRAETCRNRSDEILAALQKHDYATATAHFDARMSAAIDANKLDEIWQTALPRQFGAFAHAATTTMDEKDGMAIARTPLEFANGWLEMRVACNADGSVGGLFFAPGTAPSAASKTATPTAPGATDIALSVSTPLGNLPGTLTLPAGDGPFPAVLLVAGSGPHDRDESVGPNKPFLDIARALAAKGIASYRYDKRTYVYGAQMAGKNLTVDDEVTDDAVTALELLAKQAKIDGRRVFVLGHSLGALMAPRIAARDPQVAGVILLAGPNALDLDVILRQMRYIAGLQGKSKQDIEAETAPLVAARDAIAHADPAHPPASEYFHAPASYWLSLRDYHAIDTARRLTQPMLVVQGQRDYQVTPRDDFAQWQAAFAHDPRVTLKEYPGLGHLLMPAGDPPSPADYQRAGHVDGKVLDDVASWIRQQAQR